MEIISLNSFGLRLSISCGHEAQPKEQIDIFMEAQCRIILGAMAICSRPQLKSLIKAGPRTTEFKNFSYFGVFKKRKFSLKLNIFA
jgi:hypothetical protein